MVITIGTSTFYNWGVVKDLSGERPPRFAPIYDTARDLLWNRAEKQLEGWHTRPDRGIAKLRKYCADSTPKTGLDGVPELNHYSFVARLIKAGIPIKEEQILKKLTPDLLMRVKYLLENEFKLL